jgi:hypoxanthine phosphoribosyltransferase
MSNTISIDPPIIDTGIIIENQYLFGGAFHLYLSYDFLPPRNYYLFLKNLNELYESLYKILYLQNPSTSEILILDEVKTGNSIDTWIKFLEKINPSKKGWVVLSIVGTLFTSVSVYGDFIEKKANIELAQQNTKKIEEEITKISLEKQLIAEQVLQIKLQNQLLKEELEKRNVEKEHIDKILEPENQKKIRRKVRSALKQVTTSPMNKTIINNTVIYNNKSEEETNNDFEI